ncbi:ATP synthase F1 subunit delta [Ureaplasma urealyticum]|uniref:ATP synthase subunit delta n=3 Tax=Ureaplasma urealyticum TaxID=2130 RepID=ATPD_UREU1|nr:ATP synthase F1 subunit delta [Ureaplasma urealyticum]B5ZAW6.1 RecName: Full=ATP synthase subunit delta; AltName: Full=ATP synthase F(1) sector subunit delta; AltName: Full=F-type ATPase subunit delta; Short=F-ATPase subunit delta [Ureaplasma urealyticum serovar 10 str. ATCC 33699]EDX53823.1 ATP synthase F1, delta subunit [Ureaplasma urealyticum serovar 9 str. ATCC 33175]RCT49624.1 ATP synthase F1 subunit delta [Ureaplasma parvum]ACI59949.1 ATP synthase F1, delta subunit [Ureaplasma urealyti
MKSSLKPVEKYAYSIFEIAKEEKKLDLYKHNLETINSIIEEVPAFFEAVGDPARDRNERKQIVIKNLEGEIDIYLISLIDLLIDVKSIKLLKKIVLKALDFVNEALSVKKVLITTAYELTKNQIDRLVQSLKKKYACEKIEPIVVVDKSIIGGLSINFESQVLDNSLKTKLFNVVKKTN